jgi:S-adenosylmethionine decarboxylase
MSNPPAFFEGPEKKIELAVVDGFPSLRSFGHERWTRVVRAAEADVLSIESNDHCDAYLLSESSLFVYDNFMTMITCGRTRIVEGLADILTFVPPEKIAVAFYERKNEHFPHEQSTTFFEDARRMSEWLPGRAVGFGAEHEHAVYLFHTERPHRPEARDTTLEILMHGIDPSVAERFRSVEVPRVGTVAAELGLADVLPGFELDEHVFEPAGYSLNALKDEWYATIHVTPEDLGSYASFETNMDFRDNAEGLVQRVVNRFVPDSFDIVAFVPDERPIAIEVPKYLLRKHMHTEAGGYQVTFQHWYRPETRPSPAFTIDLW